MPVVLTYYRYMGRYEKSFESREEALQFAAWGEEHGELAADVIRDEATDTILWSKDIDKDYEEMWSYEVRSMDSR